MSCQCNSRIGLGLVLEGETDASAVWCLLEELAYNSNIRGISKQQHQGNPMHRSRLGTGKQQQLGKDRRVNSKRIIPQNKETQGFKYTN